MDKLLAQAEEYLKTKPLMKALCEHMIQRFFVTPYFAIQQEDGRYFTAREDKWDKESPFIDVSPEIIFLALNNYLTIGPYTTSREDKCKFLCLDFDEPKIKTGEISREKGLSRLRTKVKQCLDILEKDLNFQTTVIFSGRKGYHIFVCFEHPVLAKYAHDVGHYVVNQVDPKIEVFPKQVSLKNTVKGIGNNIKMPLCWHRASKNRSQIVNKTNGFTPVPQQYTALMNMPYNEVSKLMIAYSYSTIEEGKVKERLKKSMGKLGTTKANPNADPFRVKINGPGERNVKQYQFIMECMNKGYSPNQIKEAGTRWLHLHSGKFSATLQEAEEALENSIVYIWKKRFGKNISFTDTARVV